MTELGEKVKKIDTDQANDVELLLLMLALMRAPIPGTSQRMKIWFVRVNTRRSVTTSAVIVWQQDVI